MSDNPFEAIDNEARDEAYAEPIEGTIPLEGEVDMEAVGLLIAVQNASQMFDAMAQMRHEKGALEYGQFTFLERDVLTMAQEELVDLSNYARYMFIKIELLKISVMETAQELLGVSSDGDIKMGTDGFVPLAGE